MSADLQGIPVITIDGPSGTGKGTVTQLLARHLDWHILDSGALYRVVAVGIEDQAIPLANISDICHFARQMDVVFSGKFEGSIELNDKEISAQVRLEESGEKASVIAAIPELRQALFARQLAFQQLPGLVADGRDMGTAVFPESILKFFLTASAKERADRRYKQLIDKGVNVNLRALLKDIESRDERDAKRSASPMVAARDAILIDTSALDLNEVMKLVLQEVEKKGIIVSGTS